MLPTRTPEQRAADLLKAEQARRDVAKERKANEHLLKLKWLDENYWLTLASAKKVRMPPSNEPCSLSRMRKYLKRTNVPLEKFGEHYTSIQYFMENNPRVPLFAFVGMCLELANG